MTFNQATVYHNLYTFSLHHTFKVNVQLYIQIRWTHINMLIEI